MSSIKIRINRDGTYSIIEGDAATVLARFPHLEAGAKNGTLSLKNLYDAEVTNSTTINNEQDLPINLGDISVSIVAQGVATKKSTTEPIVTAWEKVDATLQTFAEFSLNASNYPDLDDLLEAMPDDKKAEVNQLYFSRESGELKKVLTNIPNDVFPNILTITGTTTVKELENNLIQTFLNYANNGNIEVNFHATKSIFSDKYVNRKILLELRNNSLSIEIDLDNFSTPDEAAAGLSIVRKIFDSYGGTTKNLRINGSEPLGQLDYAADSGMTFDGINITLNGYAEYNASANTILLHNVLSPKGDDGRYLYESACLVSINTLVGGGISFVCGDGYESENRIGIGSWVLSKGDMDATEINTVGLFPYTDIDATNEETRDILDIYFGLEDVEFEIEGGGTKTGTFFSMDTAPNSPKEFILNGGLSGVSRPFDEVVIDDQFDHSKWKALYAGALVFMPIGTTYLDAMYIINNGASEVRIRMNESVTMGSYKYLENKPKDSSALFYASNVEVPGLRLNGGVLTLTGGGGVYCECGTVTYKTIINERRDITTIDLIGLDDDVMTDLVTSSISTTATILIPTYFVTDFDWHPIYGSAGFIDIKYGATNALNLDLQVQNELAFLWQNADFIRPTDYYTFSLGADKETIQTIPSVTMTNQSGAPTSRISCEFPAGTLPVILKNIALEILGYIKDNIAPLSSNAGSVQFINHLFPDLGGMRFRPNTTYYINGRWTITSHTQIEGEDCTGGNKRITHNYLYSLLPENIEISSTYYEDDETLSTLPTITTLAIISVGNTSAQVTSNSTNRGGDIRHINRITCGDTVEYSELTSTTTTTLPATNESSAPTTIKYTITPESDGSVTITYIAMDSDGNDITDQFYTLTVGDSFMHKEVI